MATFFLLLSGALIVCSAEPEVPSPAPPAQSFQKEIRPFLAANCFACHGNGKAKADLTLDKYTDDFSVQNDRKVWDNVLQKLHDREMPPKEKPQPATVEVDAVIKSIEGLLSKLDCGAEGNAGRVTIRRLNKTEYNNTIRDLIGIDFKPASDFPADDVGYGFDNIGDVLSVSPLLLEKYLTAAEAILDQAIVVSEPPQPHVSRAPLIRNADLTTRDESGAMLSFDDGEYVIRAKVAASGAGKEAVRGMLRLDGKDQKEFKITGASTASSSVEIKVRMKAGTFRVAVAFLNPSVLNPDELARALHLEGIEIEGPFHPPTPELPLVHRRLMAHRDGISPRAAAAEIVARFAAKAYRRPLRPGEVEKCLALFDVSQRKGQRFELGIRAALYRVLISPDFLFRIELDPEGSKEGTRYQVNEYELASRLSYFLWNSMPDDRLFALAAGKQLRRNLAGEVRRMVADAKSASFLQGFCEQWLTLRKLELSSPDPGLFPAFDRNLRQSMIRESDLFFDAIAREDRSVLELLDADFTFVNEPLARLYGIHGVKGADFVRVKLPAKRGGVLTQASVLTLTSNATRTSPVKRGKFVLEQIFNTPPPPPPDDVPPLDEGRELKGTLRQVMEQHRANALCASCHQKMDPLGFAFENFDAVGAWREKDAGGFDIDASGVLPDGRTFTGAPGLRKILQDKKELFIRCISEKMLTYATGRGLEYYDRCAVDGIMAGMAKNKYRFSSLLLEVVRSDPFQMRTATGEAP